MSMARRGLGLMVAAVALAGLGLGSRAAYEPPGGDQALLRLSWRLRGQRVETCRTRTPEELAALPVHMRTPEVCTGYGVGYRLVLRIDEQPPDTLRFLPAGAKGDRPVFVLHDRALEPGPHRVRMEFTATDPLAAGADGQRSGVTHDSLLHMRPGRVLLVGLEAGGDRFVFTGD